MATAGRQVIKLRKPTPDTRLGLILTDDIRRGAAEPYVSKLRPGAIADASGQFKIGDRVLSVNGVAVRDHATATDLMRNSPECVEIEIERKGSTKPRHSVAATTVTVKLDGCGPLGIGLGLDASNTITMVKPGTPAEAACLALGDRILSVDGTALNGRAMADVMQAADSHVLQLERVDAPRSPSRKPSSPLARLSRSRSKSLQLQLPLSSASGGGGAAPAAPPTLTTHVVRVRRGPDGLGLDIQDNFVLSIVQGSPAFEDKALHVGDEVLEVEGEVLGDRWLADVLSMPRLRVLPALSFKVRRGGDFKPIQLPAGPMPTLQRDGTVKRTSVDAKLADGWQPSPAAAPAPAGGRAKPIAAAADAVAGAVVAVASAPVGAPRGRGVSQQERQAVLSAKAAAGDGGGGRVLPGTQHVLIEAAEAAGVPLELVWRIEAAGVRAVLGSSWVAKRAASKHLIEPPMGIDEALRHTQSFPGAHRGWTLHFDDGSFLRLVRAGWRRDGKPLGGAEWSRDGGH